MPRPRKYDDSQILKVAAEIFLEHGASASTALIAERAGVSEGILFKRFGTKDALFEASLKSDIETEQWREELVGNAGRNTPAGNLKRAILALHEKLERLIPRFMILEGQGKRRPFPSGPKAPPLEDAEALSAYFRHEIKLGRLKMSRPELHAHEIVAVVIHYTAMALRHQTRVCSPEYLARHLIELHLGDSAATRVRKSDSRKQK
jgi:AcrR family transcriptional regulator